MNPTISIIIPTYNRAELLKGTLDSVMKQTYEQWECIIVDDGSSDNTKQVVENYINKDSRFKYYERPPSLNKGANACRNYGFKQSKGSFVKWFDSEYPDVAGTPELRAVADNRTIDLTQKNPDWSPKQIMQEAAESTRQWAKEFLSPNTNERVARKQKIVQHPKATNASARLGEEEPVPETAADIIEEMKRVRGQVIQ